MTNEELLNTGIYCPNKINISIIIYLELGFGILLYYHNNYFILRYLSDFINSFDVKTFIHINNICNPDNINICHPVRTIGLDTADIYIINNVIAWNIYINQDDIRHLKNYILTNYGD